MPKNKNLLVTGFLPFQGEKINPSQRLAQELSRKFKILHLILPVSYKIAYVRLEEFILRELQSKKAVDFCLMLGQAGGRRKIGIERIALNLEDSSLKDEDADFANDREIVEGAPLALRSNLDLSSFCKGIDPSVIDISNSAGTFVCNSIYYRCLFEKQISKKFSGTQFSFVHVPQFPEQNSETFRGSDGIDFDTSLTALSQLVSNIQS